MDGKTISEMELAFEQGYVFLNEIFKELCPEEHDPENLFQMFVDGARAALIEWQSASATRAGVAPANG